MIKIFAVGANSMSEMGRFPPRIKFLILYGYNLLGYLLQLSSTRVTEMFSAEYKGLAFIYAICSETFFA